MKPGWRWLMWVVVVLVAAPALQGAEPKVTSDKDQRVFLTVSQSPEGPVSPGQKVLIRYQFYTPTYYNDAIYFEPPLLDNALVMPPESINGRQSFQQQMMTLQTIQMAVYPTQEGIIQFPDLEFSVPAVGQGGGTIPRARIRARAFVLLVRTPPSMDGLRGFVAAPDLSVNDTWEVPEGALEKGDLLTRTLELKVRGVPAMVLPDFKVTAPRGISVLATEPSLNTSDGREGMVGTLTQRVTYAIERPGSYLLGGESLVWWKTEGDGARQTLVLEEKRADAGGLPLTLVFGLAGTLVSLMLCLFCARWVYGGLNKERMALKRGLKKSTPHAFPCLAYRWLDRYGVKGDATVGTVFLEGGDGAEWVRQLFGSQYARTPQAITDWPRVRRHLIRAIMARSGTGKVPGKKPS